MLCERIAHTALDGTDGACWLEIDRSGRPLTPTTSEASLYGGSGGIALAFGSLAAVTGDRAWAERAILALGSPGGRPDAVPWLETGWAGDAYVRACLAAMVDRPDLLDGAVALLVDAPTHDELGLDTRLDVLGGWSGVLAAMLAVLERTDRAEATSRAALPFAEGHAPEGPTTLLARRATALCTDIVAQVERRIDDPLRQARMDKLGYAHGITGISAVLQRAGHTLGDRRATEAAQVLLDREDAKIAHRDGRPGWRPRAKADPVRSWCWGAAGYAVARTGPAMDGVDAPHLCGAVDVLDDADRDRSHLCCGEAGQLVALDAVARSGDGRARRAADRLAAQMVRDTGSDGPWHFYETTSFTPPSLFWGLGGIAYALLRVSRPDVVPNVLTAS
jgi:lantibiotic modifying enzyme